MERGGKTGRGAEIEGGREGGREGAKCSVLKTSIMSTCFDKTHPLTENTLSFVSVTGRFDISDVLCGMVTPSSAVRKKQSET